MTKHLNLFEKIADGDKTVVENVLQCLETLRDFKKTTVNLAKFEVHEVMYSFRKTTIELRRLFASKVKDDALECIASLNFISWCLNTCVQQGHFPYMQFEMRLNSLYGNNIGATHMKNIKEVAESKGTAYYKDTNDDIQEYFGLQEKQDAVKVIKT